jgi:hypothetical protein
VTNTDVSADVPERETCASNDRRAADDRLLQMIQKTGELLPMPGPITSFGFLNTLQALENFPFDEGMQKGALLYGCQPYLTEELYRQKLVQGRIQLEDLSAVLGTHLGLRADEMVCGLSTRHELWLALLRFPLETGSEEELQWFVAEMDALHCFREEVPPDARKRLVQATRHWVARDLRGRGGQGADAADPRIQSLLSDLIPRFQEASVEHWNEPTQEWESLSLQTLWRVCDQGVRQVKPQEPPLNRLVRHRDLLREVTGADSDLWVDSLLIRFCAAFTDQGFAPWSLPHREQGFYQAFCRLYRQPRGPLDRWLLKLPQELARLESVATSPLDSILESLELLGVPEPQWDEFITATLLALRGWAGMLFQMEIRGDRVPRPVPTGTLAEYLAVRLILERVALAELAREKMDYEGPLDQIASVARARITKQWPASNQQRAFLVFQLAQVLNWSPPALFNLSSREWKTLVAEIEAFSGLERRRLFQQTFERRLRVQALDAISIRSQRRPERVESPAFQAVFCIDAREESFRRHLEELAPNTETFGAPGFFVVPMYYRGVADAHYSALCPIVMKPKHWVVEEVVYSLKETNRRRAKTRQTLATASHKVHIGSRNIAGGVMLTAGLGVFATFPLVARVLFPRLTARIRRAADQLVQPPPITRLRLERLAPTPGPEGDQIGFSVDEMADMGERLLRDIGLVSGLARVVMFLGHGSSCLNNPHKSAYDCGACTGNAGSPNARALAMILNDARVRTILAQRGLEIPSDTVFLGGLHNTATETVTFLDLDRLPKSHIPDYERAKETLDEVCSRNAHERCRRFDSAPLDLSYEAAHFHVEDRSEDLAQTRPEFGNASNAMCFVGRRERIRGLFLDRRCFMNSYDPTQDDDQHTILARILAAAVPVCEGINMQYYLSYVDSPGWGCGTKLPHNITSLLGVMDGAASDLRPGLPWQGVEIHEPVRLLFIIESTPEGMMQIMERNPVVGRILKNGWAQLAVLSPDSSKIRIFHEGEFQLHVSESQELSRASSSIDWYRGWRNHLGFAVIEPATPADPEHSE